MSPSTSDPGIWETLPVEDVWRRYVASVVELAESGHVDVMSHPDLAKIYGRRPEPEILAELHETFAAGIARSGVAIEVSTAGLRKPVRRSIRPNRSCEHSIAMGCTSRLHPTPTSRRSWVRTSRPALDLVRRVGYETVSVFDRREPRQEPLFR